MTRKATIIGVILMLGLSACAKEDPNERANALFVEATKQFNDAANAKTDTAVGLYRESLAKLDAIITKYPTSTIAVQLASGQAIGNVSRLQVERKFTAARKEQCPTDPDSACLLQMALDYARVEIEGGTPVGLPDYGLLGLAKVIDAQINIGNPTAAQEISKEIISLLSKRQQKTFTFVPYLPRELAFAVAHAGDKNEALLIYRSWGSDPVVVAKIEVLSSRSADYAFLRDKINALPEKFGSTFYGYADLARRMIEVDSRESAEEAYLKALSFAKKGGDVWSLYSVSFLADIAGRLNQRESAAAALRDVIQYATNDSKDAHVLRGVAALGQVDKAMSIAAANPSDPAPLYDIAIGQAQDGRLEAARETLKKAQAIADGLPSRSNDLISLAAEANAWVGNKAASVQIARGIKNAGTLAETLAIIASSFARKELISASLSRQVFQ